LIRDVSPRLVEQLDSLICADAVSLSNPININTLSPQHAPLLAALLGPDVSEMSMRNLIADRPEQGFTDSGRFWAHPALAYLDLKGVKKNLFNAYPRRLHVQIDVELSGIKNRMKSDIHFYPDGTYTIISRSFGNM
jgi:general secretion pathway protein K